MANGNKITIGHTGPSNYILHNNFVHLNSILHVPSVSKNLLSISKFCKDNFVSLRFDAHSIYLKDHPSKDLREIVIGTVKDGLYQIELDVPSPPEANACTSVYDEIWHKLWTHNSTHLKLKFPLELVYGHVWGPAPCISTTSHRYYLLLSDVCTQFNWIYPLNSKSQVRKTFIDFKVMVEKLIDP